MHSLRSLMFISCLFILGCSSSRQIPTWEFSGGPYAQNISTVFVDEHDKSHLLAGLTTGEVYTSTDGGVSWRTLSTPRAHSAISRFVQHPDDPRRFFAATDSGLFVSTNSGANWDEIEVDPSVSRASFRIVAIEPYNTQIMYTGCTGRGMYKSTNDGGNWFTCNNGIDSAALPKSEVYDIVIDQSKPDKLFAALREIGIVASTDGGNSWTKITSIIGSGGIAPTSIVLNRKSPTTLCFGMEAGSIYKSVDNGQTWSPTRFGSGSNSPVHLVSHPSDPDMLYAGTENDLLVSSDFGSTWKSVANGIPHVTTSVVVASGTPLPVLYAYGEGIGLSRSIDNGASWISLPGRLGGSTVSSIAGDLRGGVLQATVGASVHQWKAETQAWTSISNGLAGGAITSIAVWPDSSSILHVGTVSGLYDTWDGGRMWSIGSPQLRGKQVSLVASHPIFKTRLLAESEGELLVSTDNGSTWSRTKPLNERYHVQSFTFSSTDAGLVLGATEKSGVILSTNGGLSWEANRYGLESSDLVAVTFDDKDKQTFYAWTRHGNGFRSTNRGLVWDRYTPPWQPDQEVHIAIDKYNPTDMIAITGAHQLYYSSSGGANWFMIPTGSLQGEVTSALWNSVKSTLYVGIREVGVYRISLGEYLKKLFGVE